MIQTQYNFTIDNLARGKRIDKFLSQNINLISRVKIQYLIEAGNLIINDKVVNSCKYLLQEGDRVSLLVESTNGQPITETRNLELNLEIIYEDQDILIINKPAGLLVHPGAGRTSQVTLVDYIKQHCGSELSAIGGEARPGIVHRLDLETSGLMVIAKNDVVHHILAEQFQNREVEKRYFAVTKSVISPKFGSIHTCMKKSDRDKTKNQISSQGKEAITKYQVTEEYCKGSFSLLDIELLTGRTHQIRVHLEYKKCPIIGDKLYGKSLNFNFKELEPSISHLIKTFPRHALHAYKLSFCHPTTDERLSFVTDLPDDMKNLIELLRAC